MISGPPQKPRAPRSQDAAGLASRSSTAAGPRAAGPASASRKTAGEPLAQDVTASAKRSRSEQPRTQGDTPAVASTQSALVLPQVLTSRKQKYPHARASDLNANSEKDFQQAQAIQLRRRLGAQNLSLRDLLGPNNAAALNQEDAARTAHQGAEQALHAACPGIPKQDVDAAVDALRPLGRDCCNAQSRLGAAQRQLAAAQARLNDPRVPRLDANAAHAAATQRLDAARGELAKAQGALVSRMPEWARKAQPATVLPALVTSAVRLRAAEVATNRRVRITWIELGDRQLTKLTHFASGSFGKVTLAMRASDHGLRALKDLRTEVGKKSGTAVTDLEAARREVGYMRDFYAPDVTISRNPDTKKLTIDMPLALGSLDHIQPGPHAVPLTRSTGRQVFAALAHMHAENVLHNDIKPGNINVHGDGRILPADFGKTAPLADGSDIGTPAFAAPEQIESQESVEHSKADVWAAGLSLAASHVSIEGLPFAVQDVTQMLGPHRDYAQWHATMVDAAAANPAHRILQDASGSHWSKYFKQLHAVDPQVCNYLLAHVLTPQAKPRATAAEASAFFAQLQPETGTAEQQLRTHLGGLENTPARQAAQIALRLRAEFQLLAPPR